MKSWIELQEDALVGTAPFETERLLLDITEAFVGELESRGITRSELARKLDVDRSAVTRLLSGDKNMTIRTMVAVASALGCRATVALEPIGVSGSGAGATEGYLAQCVVGPWTLAGAA